MTQAERAGESLEAEGEMAAAGETLRGRCGGSMGRLPRRRPIPAENRRPAHSPRAWPACSPGGASPQTRRASEAVRGCQGDTRILLDASARKHVLTAASDFAPG